MTSNYCGGGIYDIFIGNKLLQLSVDEINEITSHNFKDNSIGDSKQELEDKLEDLEYETSEDIDFAVRALNNISKKIMKVQRRLDDLADEVENTDKELFKTLSEIGDELDEVNELTLDMETSVRGK